MDLFGKGECNEDSELEEDLSSKKSTKKKTEPKKVKTENKGVKRKKTTPSSKEKIANTEFEVPMKFPRCEGEKTTEFKNRIAQSDNNRK